MSQTAVAPAVPAKKARLDAVDGVRGLMALMIVLNHWSTGNAWGRFGWTGLYNLLEIFFMISGFFIALSALKPKPWDPAVVVDHITKRAARLWLHYLFSVFLVFALMAALPWTFAIGLIPHGNLGLGLALVVIGIGLNAALLFWLAHGMRR